MARRRAGLTGSPAWGQRMGAACALTKRDASRQDQQNRGATREQDAAAGAVSRDNRVRDAAQALRPAGEVTGEDVERFNSLLAEEIFADQRIDTDAYWALVTDCAERWAAQSKSDRNTWCTLLDRNLQTPMPDDFRAAVDACLWRVSPQAPTMAATAAKTRACGACMRLRRW